MANSHGFVLCCMASGVDNISQHKDVFYLDVDMAMPCSFLFTQQSACYGCDLLSVCCLDPGLVFWADLCTCQIACYSLRIL